MKTTQLSRSLSFAWAPCHSTLAVVIGGDTVVAPSTCQLSIGLPRALICRASNDSVSAGQRLCRDRLSLPCHCALSSATSPPYQCDIGSDRAIDNESPAQGTEGSKSSRPTLLETALGTSDNRTFFPTSGTFSPSPAAMTRRSCDG